MLPTSCIRMGRDNRNLHILDKESVRKDYDISLETILVIFAFLYFVKCSFDFPFDSDIFMMIRIGSEIWITKSIHLIDKFSWVPSSCRVPWIDYEWLPHLLTFLIFQKSDFLGIVLYKTLFYGISFLILFTYAYKKYGARPALCALILSIYLGRWFLSPRPMSYSAVFFPLLTYFLLNLENKDFSIRHFILIPLMYLLWNNLHGGFIVGLAYMGAAFLILFLLKIRGAGGAGQKYRIFVQFAVMWLLCFLVTLFCSPYGTKNFQYIIDFMLFRPVFMSAASDMASPLLRLQFNIHYFTIAGLSLLLLLLFFFRYKLKASPIELFSYFFWLICSLRAARNMQLFSTASIPVFAFIFYNLHILFDRQRLLQTVKSLLIRYPVISSTVKIIALFLVFIMLVLQLSTTDPSGKRFEKSFFPLGLRDFLRENALPSNLYNHDILGNFFLFYLYPQYKVSYDSRWNGVFTDSYFAEINNSFHDRSAFFDFVNKYKLDTIIVHYKYYGSFVDNDPRWFLLYEGERCGVYIRNVSRNEHIIKKFKDDKLYYPTDIYDVNAFLFRSHLNMENYETARKYLMRLIIAKPEEIELWQQFNAIGDFLEKKKREEKVQVR